MGFAYTKQTWVNGRGGGTPLNATRLNYIENGIEAASGASFDATNTFRRRWLSADVVTIDAGNQVGVTSMLDDDSSTGDPSDWAEWSTDLGGVKLLQPGWYKTEAFIQLTGAAVGKYFNWNIQYFVPAGYGGNTSLDVHRARTYYQGVGVVMKRLINDVSYFPDKTGVLASQHSHILVSEVFNNATTDVDVDDIGIAVWKIG